MKKLKLKALQLGTTEVLTREQLKKVLGGAGSGSGSDKCQKCCPKGHCSSSECSTCAKIPAGSHADCSDNPQAQVCDCGASSCL